MKQFHDFFNLHTCKSLATTLSMSSPTYPAMVKVVQSQMAKGTSKHLAIVCANKVLPLPVEPNIMILDFSNFKSWLEWDFSMNLTGLKTILKLSSWDNNHCALFYFLVNNWPIFSFKTNLFFLGIILNEKKSESVKIEHSGFLIDFSCRFLSHNLFQFKF